VRKSEYARPSGRDRRYIKGQKYNLLSRRENLTLDGKLKTLLAANVRFITRAAPSGNSVSALGPTIT
jgi:transposase